MQIQLGSFLGKLLSSLFQLDMGVTRIAKFFISLFFSETFNLHMKKKVGVLLVLSKDVAL